MCCVQLTLAIIRIAALAGSVPLTRVLLQGRASRTLAEHTSVAVIAATTALTARTITTTLTTTRQAVSVVKAFS